MIIETILVAAVVVASIESHLNRKALNVMSIALDSLTDKISALESKAAIVIADIATLQASGENAPALDALSARVQAVTDSLTTAVAPK